MVISILNLSTGFTSGGKKTRIFQRLFNLKRVALYICLIILLSSCQSKDHLFKTIASGHSGITFSNTITANDSSNILTYEYIYNGAGVAVADFNNDGLPDLYFVGNEVSNRLYLNQGDFNFRDVTKESKTGGFNQWYSGVSVVDINADGLPDIYLNATRNKNPKKRKNVLFVNQGVDKQGVPVFKNEAEAYKLASTAYSTQAVFFDYDNDGDLDMYEVVADKSGSRQLITGHGPEEIDPANVDRLYRCDWKDSLGHPVYTNVSKKAGINKPGYGLGAHVFDINDDGWKDIYVSNDYLSNDLLWINNGNGTFTDRAGAYFKHTSFAGMGIDVGDINNDGLPDLVQLDMAGRSNYARQTTYAPDIPRRFFNKTTINPQLPRNTLQINQGFIPLAQDSLSHPIFSDVSLLAGVAHTNWSWGVLMADFNNDGYKDLIITNGIPKKINDKDFMAKRGNIKGIGPQWMLLDALPPQKTSNLAFENKGALKFSNVTKAWGLKNPSYSTGMVWADLDSDGNLDLIISNINETASIYENTLNDKNKCNCHHWLEIKFEGGSHNTMGLGAEVDIYYNGVHQATHHTIYRGYLSSVENMTHFGLGKITRIDSLVVSWPQQESLKKQVWKNVKADQVIIAKAANAKRIEVDKKPVSQRITTVFLDVTKEKGVDFVDKEKPYNDFRMQGMLSEKISQSGPGLAAGDVNGDGLQDIFIGGSKNEKGTFLMQQPDGSFKQQDLLPGLGGRHKMQEDEGVLLFDADNDGDLDLYIVSGSDERLPQSPSYADRLYKNNGKGHFTRVLEALPQIYESGSVVTAADYDHDGDLDLFVGGRVKPRNYPKPVSSRILRNDSKNGIIKFIDVTASVAKPLLNIGMVTDALWSDYNNDGWRDLIISGEWMPVTILKNQKGTTFVNVTKQSGLAHQIGWWNSLVAGDFDNDGDTDYIAGNLGSNTIFEATQKRPVSIYANDFDKNGTYDVVVSHFLKGLDGQMHEYPVSSLSDLILQIPAIRNKFKSNRAYGKATIRDIFSDDELDNALVYHANNLQTSYLENNGDGTFIMKAMPVAAQLAPVYGMVSDDFNSDGNLDVLLTGNQTGFSDALNGLLLTGDGDGGFISRSMAFSDIYIPGYGRSLVKLAGAEGKYLVAAGQNEGPLKLFALSENVQLYPVKPMDSFAIIQFKNGAKRKVEFYYGSSFLSQSARFFLVTPGMKSAKITTYKGKTSTVVF